MNEKKTILVLEHLTKEFPGVRAVSDASLEIRDALSANLEFRKSFRKNLQIL